MLYNCHAKILDLEDFEKNGGGAGSGGLKWWTHRIGRFKMVDPPGRAV
jgi:hypothetical protein